ncbi:OmpH family outer membrane protein [Frigidibacter sp. SD6-1]|uniref:OmpH family outer membrane protein n=1 Tax=Frigidibacter sp. SD6-1 TaxID=3032581 RepID=UPI0024E03F92|nr:OmpH family outer membrane protein [Frigidibacter sp. SD6-1]
MRAALAGLAGLALVAGAMPASAQEARLKSPVVTVDQERLFTQSAWGKRALAEIDKDSRELQAENRRIEAALTAEEKDLTDRRPTLPAAEFRKLADAFDEKVTGIRKAQDTKLRDLTARHDTARKEFFDAVLPVMGKVMEAQGAFAILDNRAVFMSVRSIDITDEVIAAADAELGDGTGTVTAP